MATNYAQRFAAFFLALLFLLSTIGATAYVIWQINQDPVVDDTPAITEQTDGTTVAENACGTGTFDPVTPPAIPAVTQVDIPVSELKTTDIKVGEGAEVQAGDCVAALYYGTLASTGEKFDGNYETGQPIEFSLNGVIQGWAEGIPGMRVGGVRRLEIPAELAYGDQEAGDIPANSDLVFEVEIIATRQAE